MRKFLKYKTLFLTLSTSLVFITQVSLGDPTSDSPIPEARNDTNLYSDHQKEEDDMTTLTKTAKDTAKTAKEKAVKGAESLAKSTKKGARAVKRGAKKIANKTGEAYDAAKDKVKDATGS